VTPTWLQVLQTNPSGGNGYYILAHQYEAAVLNILNGADPSAVTATLTQALALFASSANTPLTIGSLKGGNLTRQTWINLASTLEAYNTGAIGPGHCAEDQTSSSSP